MADNVAASYRALGLRMGASPEEVKQAYRDLVKIWHPDRFPDDAELRAMAHTRTVELTIAYECVQEHLRSKPPHHPVRHLSPSSRAPAHPPAKSRAPSASKRGTPSAAANAGSDGPRYVYVDAKSTRRRQFVRCEQCGHKNAIPSESHVMPSCHKCGEPISERRPVTIPESAPQSRPAVEQVTHCTSMARMSNTLAIMGLIPGFQLVVIVPMAEANGRFHSFVAALALCLFVLVVGLAALRGTLAWANHPRQGVVIGLCLLLMVIGAALPPADDSSRGIAMRLSAALVMDGVAAATLAGLAAITLLPAEWAAEWRSVTVGLILGTIDMAVGTAMLQACT